ncbi:hypothetical protein ACRQ5Q_07495 [Bradyrhizobium sp. PMVTL-01]
MKLTNEGGIVGIEVVDATSNRAFVWNGHRFVPLGKPRKGQ